MPLSKPFRRTARQFINGGYSQGGNWEYVSDPRYATGGADCVRAFLLLQKDFLELFDNIEPSDTNGACHSYRIHELMMRTCVEVEANCKAILLENGYVDTGRLNMGDYKKVNASHHLSSFEVKIPFWRGAHAIRRPYSEWQHLNPLPWYEAYNQTKHDRHANFEHASFNHLMEAICGLVTLLSAQFIIQDFSPAPGFLSLEGPADGMESALGGLFRVNYPSDWTLAEKYDFNWRVLTNDANPVLQYPYPQ